MQQHFYIYPQKLAQQSKDILREVWGWSEQDMASYFEVAQTLEIAMNQINCTLLNCHWETKGSAVIWNIQVSTPGHCDIFQLLKAIRLTFDLNGLDDHFSFIEALDDQKLSISFTFNP